MFKNYLKIALRNLIKYKGYSFINIVGLAIGMACCILILLYVQDELSYDRYHQNADRIFRVERAGVFQGTEYHTANTAHPYGAALVRDYPEIQERARFRQIELPIRDTQAQFIDTEMFFSDASLFDVFSFSLKSGDAKTALSRPSSVVLTEAMARKFLGDPEPIGKTLRVAWNDSLLSLEVTGILDELPQNSHFRSDIFISYETLNALLGRQTAVWLSNNIYTYVLLADGADVAALENKFPQFIEKYMGATVRQVLGPDADISTMIQLKLKPITDIHLHSDLENEIEANGSMATVYIFSIIALVILLIASINFMNLATARSARRAKEVGLRKVVGASRSLLIRQFIGESLWLSFLALLLAILLAEFALPAYNAFTLKELRIDYFGNTQIILGFLGIMFLVGVLGGLYPALFLSAFQPAQVLKGALATGKGNRSSFMREGLVVLQFSVSIALIISTFVVSDQLEFVKNKRLGFDKKQVVIMPIPDMAARGKLELIKAELLRHAGILKVASCSRYPGSAGFNDTIWRRFGSEGEDFRDIKHFRVDSDFLQTIGTDLVAGRFFANEHATDASNGIILNEEAVAEFGWSSAEKAVGQGIEYPVDIQPVKYGKAEVVGVVSNFHFRSLHQKVQPLIMHMGLTTNMGSSGYLAAKVSPGNISETLDFMENTWHEFSPNYPFEYFFLDAHFDSQYRAEQRMQEIFSLFATLAIFVGCLGLLGLASFMAEQRTKEIGIRKVLGATEVSIVKLLSTEFVRLVAIANLVGWPIAYWAMGKWLQNFAYHTTMGLQTFLFAGAMALGIAVLTVSFQSIKAALSNPVHALHYE